MNKLELKPALVFQYFDEICKVPRPSKKEEQIIGYLKAFGEKHNLETKVDEAGNVLIKKPATKGKENLKTVILQSHIDMVCEKNNNVEHDFLKDPIETVVDGEWLKAKGTTLGADNGIGVATELAILASDDIEHGPIECLFTVDEETGLTGAFALKEGFMNGEILINLDSEDEGELFIGCAGGANTVAEYTYTEIAAPKDYFYFKVGVEGLTGGHSGDDINKNRANANKQLVRFLSILADKYDLYLCEIKGGNLHNAIPREAHVVSSSFFAKKCEAAGVDAVVAEGFEAGGHNGREETTTLCLIPSVRKATNLPLIAAGGIAIGAGMLSVMTLGAEGVQVGTRFALTKESSAHEIFKEYCLSLGEGDTKLLLKKLAPTRLAKGKFFSEVEEAEARGASVEEMRELLGKGRARKGIFEGNLEDGELEIGQISLLLNELKSVNEVVKEIIDEYNLCRQNVAQLPSF